MLDCHAESPENNPASALLSDVGLSNFSVNSSIIMCELSCSWDAHGKLLGSDSTSQNGWNRRKKHRFVRLHTSFFG